MAKAFNSSRSLYASYAPQSCVGGLIVAGRPALAALRALSLGGRRLREQVTSLGEDLTVDATDAWACLSITVPRGRLGAQECQFAS